MTTQIAAVLRIDPRQTVNMICRKLRSEGLIKREPGPSGKLANYPAPEKPALVKGCLPLPQQTVRPNRLGKGHESTELLTEDQVKASLQIMLTIQGWNSDIAWGRSRGVDIIATRADQRWLIECKGSGSLAPMQNNYFVGVLGEIIQRMNDPQAKHSVAFPNLRKFRRLWAELPKHAKSTLQVTALFVSRDGSVLELSD